MGCLQPQLWLKQVTTMLLSRFCAHAKLATLASVCFGAKLVIVLALDKCLLWVSLVLGNSCLKL
jgi:hypothetical protein